MGINKVKLNVDFLRPGSSIVYPLYSEEGENVVEKRAILTKSRIDQIKKKYGNVVYYTIDEEKVISQKHLDNAIDKSMGIMHEISQTKKLTNRAFNEAEKVVEDIVSDLDNSEIQAICLLKELKSHEEYLHQHSVNVGILSAIFAKTAGKFTKEDIKFLTLGAYLLDIGSMKIEKHLLKKQGIFNKTDRLKISKHPQLGYEILKNIPGISTIVLQIILFHHERFNNKGYFQLPFDVLPLPPKIVGICDIYDSLTTRRPFRDALNPTEALKFLVNSINLSFNYELISDFVNLVGPMLSNTQSFYGRNDFCALSTKELGVIMDFGSSDILKPKVLVFCRFHQKKNKLSVQFYDSPIETDLNKDQKRLMVKIINNKNHIKALKSKLREKKFL
jgi:HD-GYP domain-containing protein (c-di-GMP phosphodiesterase class II)